MAEREEDKRADVEEALGSESVTEGAAGEVIFMLHGRTMVMNPRDSKHGQYISTVLMEEEGMSLSVEEAGRVAMEEDVA